MTQEQIIYLIIVLVSFLIGVFIFFLSCVYYVKKNTVIIIEKIEKFYGIYKHGFYFFWPFVYRRKGTYPIGQTNKIVKLANGKKAKVYYVIKDVYKYHYGQISIEQFFNNFIYKQEKVTIEILKKEFLTIGIELLSIQPINN